MIKRIVGLLAAAAVLAVIVFTLLGSGTYSSFIERHAAATTVATPAAAAEQPAGDRTAVDHEATSGNGAADATAAVAADSVAAGTLPQREPAAE